MKLTEAELGSLATWDRDGIYTCPSERDRCDEQCRAQHEHLADVVSSIVAARERAAVEAAAVRVEALAEECPGETRPCSGCALHVAARVIREGLS